MNRPPGYSGILDYLSSDNAELGSGLKSCCSPTNAAFVRSVKCTPYCVFLENPAFGAAGTRVAQQVRVRVACVAIIRARLNLVALGELREFAAAVKMERSSRTTRFDVGRTGERMR